METALTQFVPLVMSFVKYYKNWLNLQGVHVSGKIKTH